jgi:hypothetical protein
LKKSNPKLRECGGSAAGGAVWRLKFDLPLRVKAREYVELEYSPKAMDMIS